MPHEYELRRLTPDEWLTGFDDRYLADYVPSGGSVVRFVSGDAAALDDVREGLERIGADRQYHYRYLDAEVRQPYSRAPRLHAIECFYSAVTDGVDWQGWARRQAEQVLDRLGVRVPDGCRLGDIERLAALNGRDRNWLMQRYQREADETVQDRAMTVEFRSAVTNLWVDQLLPDTSSPGRAEVLTSWLRGQSAPLGGARVLRGCQIYGRISPTNARHYLVSFCEWARRTGHSGVLAVLDFRAYERVGQGRGGAEAVLGEIRAALARGEDLDTIRRIAGKSEDERPSVKYSKAAYMQMLSLLRRFIDEIDRFPGMALVVMTKPQFYGPDLANERRFRDYNALHTRIGQEVSDRLRANPDAALVHLRRNDA